MRNFIILTCAVFVVGCTQAEWEELKRGKPGSKNYIAPEYVQVTILRFNEGRVEDLGKSGKMVYKDGQGELIQWGKGKRKHSLIASNGFPVRWVGDHRF